MRKFIDRSMSFDQYIALIDRLLAVVKTTGPNQSDAMFGYGKINRHRMARLDKTFRPSDSVKAAAAAVTRPQVWLIVTEGWCGDAAQNVPAIEKIARQSDNIETRYLLRDENLELIDQFLTNGARSIPKLIALDAETLAVLGTWGARPAAAQRLFDTLREQGVPKPLIMENLQRWYNTDAQGSIQEEFAALLRLWSAPAAALAAA
jgi:hypothetical protein